jgi:hypothetical protein
VRKVTRPVSERSWRWTHPFNIDTAIIAANPPDIRNPPSANHFGESTNMPRIDVSSAIGVAVVMPHVDHVQMPECQLGCSHDMSPMMLHGTSERKKPIKPTTQFCIEWPLV